MAILLKNCCSAAAAVEKLVKSPTDSGWHWHLGSHCLLNKWVAIVSGYKCQKVAFDTPAMGRAAVKRRQADTNWSVQHNKIELGFALNCQLTWPVLQMQQCNPSADIHNDHLSAINTAKERERETGRDVEWNRENREHQLAVGNSFWPILKLLEVVRAQLEAVARLANGARMPPIAPDSPDLLKMCISLCVCAVEMIKLLRRSSTISDQRSRIEWANLFATRLTCLSIKIKFDAILEQTSQADSAGHGFMVVVVQRVRFPMPAYAYH